MTKRKAKPKNKRLIERLRRHPEVGGAWSWSREDGYVRADGLRLYSYSTCSISEGGCESYRTIRYVGKDGEERRRMYDLDGHRWFE